MHEALRHRLLGAWSDLVSNHPRAVLLVATLLALAALLISAVGLPLWPGVTLGPLHFQGSRNDLISRDLPWNQRFIDWARNFEGKNQIWLVIDTGLTQDQPGYPSRLEQAHHLADELGRELMVTHGPRSPHPLVQDVIWRFPTAKTSPRGIRMLPMPRFRTELQRLRDGITQAAPALRSDDPAQFLSAISAQMRSPASLQPTAESGPPASGLQPPASFESQIAQFASLIHVYAAQLAGQTDAPSFLTLLDQQTPPWRYMLSPNGRLLFMRIEPWRDPDMVNAAGRAVAGIRQLLRDTVTRYPPLQAGLAGVEVMEADETHAALRDSTIAAVIAFLLIATVLVLAFHSWMMPLVTSISLLYAIVWAFGFATLAVGHLQLLSVVFTTILLGLGIAYGVYVLARFELARHDYPEDESGFAPAMKLSIQTIGPGVITGAVGTAAAFCVTMLTKFRGVAEMGLIAGIGIILCLCAMMSVCPAILRLVKPRAQHIRSLDERYFYFYNDAWVLPFLKRPRATVLVALALATLSLLPILLGHMNFDYNLMKLLPTRASSVRWQQKIDREGGNPPYFGVSIAQNLDQARALASSFRQLSSVSDLGGMGLLFPADEAEKLSLLADARALLDQTLQSPTSAPTAPQAPPETGHLASANASALNSSLLSLRLQLAVFRSLPIVPSNLKEPMKRVDDELAAALAALSSLNPQQRQARVAALTNDFRGFRDALRAKLLLATDTQPLTPEDLPAAIRAMYQDRQGRLVIEVHPKVPPGAEGPLDPSFLPYFVADLYRVDPSITGPAVQIFESARLIKSSYQLAGLLALLAVLVITVLDFGRLDDAILSLMPAGIGFALTFGVMWLVGQRINAANIIVLPLMFGIGVDTGVHMLHRYRQYPDARPLGLSHSTGKAVTVTCLAAAIGFGSLMISSHRGMAGLGFVMVTGILLTMFACWIVLPAWLEWRARRNPQTSTIPPSPPTL